MSSAHHSGDEHHGELGHIIPFSIYRNVCIALFVLTVITVVVSKVEFFDFGNWNIVIAMLIASVKATLVVLFFMHLKYEDVATWLYAFFPLALLALLMGGVFLDEPFRHDPRGANVQELEVAE